ncbi:MAG: tetratricopeptide repeat protein, partial [Candidatus Binataceae bacterium]
MASGRIVAGPTQLNLPARILIASAAGGMFMSIAAVAIYGFTAVAVGMPVFWPPALVLLIGSLLPGGWYLGRAIERRFVARGRADFHAALERGDIAGARRCADDLLALVRTSPRTRMLLPVAESERLLADERWAEALSKLAEIDSGNLDSRWRAQLQNDIAWCQVELGNAGEAERIARQALGELSTDSSDVALALRTTLGAALATSDRPDDAIAVL